MPNDELKVLDENGVVLLATDIKTLSDATYPANAAIASAYDSTSIYHIGDYCLYGGLLYKCNTEIATGGEPWIAAHWTQVSVANELGNTSANFFYGVCDTAAGTAAKEVTISGITELTVGLSINVKFTYNNTAFSPTLSVNSLDSKPIYQYGTTAASVTSETTGWYAGAVVQLTYDGTGWVRDQGYNYYVNTTYPGQQLVHFATCSTAATEYTKVISNITPSVSFTNGTLLNVYFTYSTTATTLLRLSVNGTTKNIKVYGYSPSAAYAQYLWDAGSIVQFMYCDGFWHLINPNVMYSEITSRHLASNSVQYSKLASDLQTAVPKYVTLPSVSDSNRTFTVSGITVNHRLIQEGCVYFSNPSAVGSDLILTTGSGTVTVTGTLTGTTDIIATFSDPYTIVTGTAVVEET